tara:strand:+ start:59 stop:1396 length:1338 start_codon:yes stop_codon:yes gene_type:complete
MTAKRPHSQNVNSILKSKVESTFSDLDKSQKSYKNYLSGFNTKATQKTYEAHFKQFVDFGKYESYDSIIAKDPKILQQEIKDYIVYLKEKNNRHSTMKNNLCAIKLFLDTNDIELNYKSVKKIIGKETKQLGGRKAYTLQQVQDLFYAKKSLRTKALIATLASSGMRIGAIQTLKVGHLKRQEDGGALIVVYEGSIEEYVAGLTPEAVSYVDQMLDERRNAGLEINDNTPLFTMNTLGTKKKTNNPMTDDSLTRELFLLTRIANLQREKKDNRYETSQAHALRKFFKTQCHSVKYTINDKSVQAIETVIIERLMGHSQTSVKMTYLDTSEKELYAEYQKAIPALTISQEWRLEQKVEKMQFEINNTETEEMTQLKRNIAEMQVKLEETNPESVNQENQVIYNNHLEDKVAELTAIVQNLVQENQELTKGVKSKKPLAIENVYSRY